MNCDAFRKLLENECYQNIETLSHGGGASFSACACVPWCKLVAFTSKSYVLRVLVLTSTVRHMTIRGGSTCGYRTLLEMTNATPELKNLCRLFGIGGRGDEWPDWSFATRAYLGITSDHLARILERAESLTTTITIELPEQTRLGITTSVRQTTS